MSLATASKKQIPPKVTLKIMNHELINHKRLCEILPVMPRFLKTIAPGHVLIEQDAACLNEQEVQVYGHWLIFFFPSIYQIDLLTSNLFS